MRQVLQSLTDGRTELAEVPEPRPARGQLLVRTRCSLISSGTERMLVGFGRAGWLAKAREHPERVREVLDKVRTDGLLQTVAAVRSKLDRPQPLGYCSVGSVLEVGADVRGFAPGDRVVTNGPHAEIVAVPQNLCALVPPQLADETAVFAVLGAVALQGIRLAAPTLGERFAVIGLGLVGLLAVQLLRANGCRVLGIDPNKTRVELARIFGADTVAADCGDDPLASADAFSDGRGVDGVLIAAATASTEPMSLAAQMCRKRGRIVLLGVAGLELERSEFYEKELTFQVSCSYGPGRYDPKYEEQGHDYPLGFVRWTEQRNFQALLELLSLGSIDVRPLITHRFAFENAPAAYDLLASAAEPHLGILLEYAAAAAPAERSASLIWRDAPAMKASGEAPSIAFIGAGNYAGRILIPAFAASGVRLYGIASSGGVSAAYQGRKHRFARATTDPDTLLHAKDVDVVVVATRHDTHAHFALRALAAGKAVFVEKPLAIHAHEVDAIEDAWQHSAASGRRPQLMVGFNRRFAPHATRMKALLDGVREPKSFIVTVNAGAISSSHWTQDPGIGGGRIIGEACHFIDLLRFLAGHPIIEARARAAGRAGAVRNDEVAITLGFADGSCGTIHYLASGHRGFPKERIEVFCGGRILQLDNFRRLRGYGWRGFGGLRLFRQDKGQRACVRSFIEAVRNGEHAPIPFGEIVETARVTIALAETLRR
jgi:predicted dehydrogenase